MVSIEQTSRKYRGRKAVTYDATRRRQARWALENETVERWLRELRPVSVLDCPVGTGRFLPLYRELGVSVAIGVDASVEMLRLASRKPGGRSARGRTVRLITGDARRHESTSDGLFDVSVCVRFLDLIDEAAMQAVMREMFRVTRRAVLLTIRLGSKYQPKTNTATHARRRFGTLLDRGGWLLHEAVPFRDAGWEIIQLRRRS